MPRSPTCSSPLIFNLMHENKNRWIIAAAGIVMQIALGAVYAWSVFRIPLTQAYGWSISQVTLTFELAILVLGLAAFAGGLWMKRAGPRRMAVIGGVWFSAGGRIGGPNPRPPGFALFF